MAGPNTCIYCKRDESAVTFDGVEHVIPQAFGVFGSETPTLKCVCDECNGGFGRTLDIYLARETLEGVIRYKNGIFSSEARPQKHLHIALDEGPQTGDFAGMKVAIDGTTGELMKPLAQFHILNQQSGKTETYFKKQIAGLKLPDDVYGRPGDGSGNGTWKCAIFAGSKADHDEIVEALQANGIAFIPAEPFELPGLSGDEKHPFDASTLPVLITGEVTHTHRRAHAKILMNFLAKYFGEEEALKPHWDYLRSFICGEAGTIRYKVFDDPFPDNQDSDVLKIIRGSIAAWIENRHGNIVGSLQFYGNQIFQYLLRELAALPDDQQFGYCYTDGETPKILVKAKDAASATALAAKKTFKAASS